MIIEKLKLELPQGEGYEQCDKMLNTIKQTVYKVNEIIDELNHVKALSGIDTDEYYNAIERQRKND